MSPRHQTLFLLFDSLLYLRLSVLHGVLYYASQFLSTAPGTMRHLSSCCILTIFLSIAVAAYTPSHASLSTFHQLQTPSRTRSVFSRLRDGLIRSVWSIPSCNGERGASNDVKSAAPPPSTLLARYGGDVVLRFSINSPEEAAALTEAVHVLFLDVWEFNADWVDIRLAKEVVRLHLTPGWHNRYLLSFERSAALLAKWNCYLHVDFIDRSIDRCHRYLGCYHHPYSMPTLP